MERKRLVIQVRDILVNEGYKCRNDLFTGAWLYASILSGKDEFIVEDTHSFIYLYLATESIPEKDKETLKTFIAILGKADIDALFVPPGNKEREYPWVLIPHPYDEREEFEKKFDEAMWPGNPAFMYQPSVEIERAGACRVI